MLYTETVVPGTLRLLTELMNLEILSPYYLVGGTSLALQTGYRMSVDLDLFGKIPLDYDELTQELSKHYPVKEIFKNPHMVQYRINETKIDVVGKKDFLIRPLLKADGIRLASLEDIAAMKINAVEYRGYKRDFFDLHFLIKRFGLELILDFTRQKYPASNKLHSLRSLLDFADAEDNDDPLMLEKVTWEEVKEFITQEVRKVLS